MLPFFLLRINVGVSLLAMAVCHSIKMLSVTAQSRAGSLLQVLHAVSESRVGCSKRQPPLTYHTMIATVGTELGVDASAQGVAG